MISQLLTKPEKIISENTQRFVTAVIVAAGESRRMGGDMPKQFMELCGAPVLAHTLTVFQRCKDIDAIIVVTAKRDIDKVRSICGKYEISKLVDVAEGGTTRQRSVSNGVGAAPPRSTHYAIHDGARPLVTCEVIERAVSLACEKGAAAAAVKVNDTLKSADTEKRINATVDRSSLYAVQTPQVFEREVYLKALDSAFRDGVDMTDDCQLLERVGEDVYMSEGSVTNIKLTTPEDFILAGAVISGRNEL